MKCSEKRSALGLVLFFLLVAPALLGLSSDRTIPPDIELDSAWVGQGSMLTKLAGDAGQLKLRLAFPGQVQAIAVDDKRLTVWAFGQGVLRNYDLKGNLLSSRTLSRRDSSQHVDLAVATATGQVWLASQKSLYQVDRAGRLIGTHSLKHPVQALAIDQDAAKLWLATNKSVSAYDAAGNEAGSARLASRAAIKDLAFDSRLGLLWIAQANALQWFARDGRTQSFPMRGIAKLTTDGQGGVWAASNQSLIRIDASGVRLLEVVPPDALVDVEANLRDGSVWRLGTEWAAKYDLNGQLLIQRHRSEIGKGALSSLALYIDLVPPTLSTVEPKEGAYLSTLLPKVRLEHDRDVDLRTLKAEVNGAEVILRCQPDRAAATCHPAANLLEGDVTLALTAEDYAGNLSAPAEARFTLDITPPEISLSSPVDGFVTNEVTVVVLGRISEMAELKLNGTELSLDGEQRFATSAGLAEGLNTLQLLATDRAGNAAERSVQVVLDTIPPAVPTVGAISISQVVDGKATVIGQAGSVEPGSTVTITNTRTGEKVVVRADVQGRFSATLAAQPGDVFSISVGDAAGNGSPPEQVSVPRQSPDDLPPDPEDVAPPLPLGGAVSLKEATSFLYSGPNPIQTGVQQGTINAVRAAVVRGRVIDRRGEPLAGAVITIQGRPEFGQTLSRMDGGFDMAVNGGGALVVNYEKAGFLPAQRRIQVPWQDYAVVDDVALVPLDRQVTEIAAGAAGMQIARGSVVSDIDGERRATVLFPAGTTAAMTLPDGTAKPLTTLHVRATEYTVGIYGRQAMPGELPSNSGYTYAVELSVDEAIEAGAVRVDFTQPLPVYVDNFLRFPVGSVVPVGWYDRERAAWIPSENGRIVQILGRDSEGRTTLDIDGSGEPASIDELSGLGISDEERRQLALLFPLGKSLWRAPVTHFTPWDYNWPYGPPDDAESPEEPPTKEDDDDLDPEEECKVKGCIIGVQSQTLGPASRDERLVARRSSCL
jgi:hypothetical protein